MVAKKEMLVIVEKIVNLRETKTMTIIIASYSCILGTHSLGIVKEHFFFSPTTFNTAGDEV